MAKTKAVKRQLPNQTLFTGDNLDVLRGINSDSIDLIYLDPPFNSNQNFAAPIGSEAAGAEFKDTWTMDDIKAEWIGLIDEENEALANLLRTAGQVSGKKTQAYLTYMAIRLLEMHRVLKPTGTLLLHCDDTMGPWLEVLTEAIWGSQNRLNSIIWRRNTGRKGSNKYGRSHDIIIVYAQTEGEHVFTVPHKAHEEEYAKRYKHTDKYGDYQDIRTISPSRAVLASEAGQPWRGHDAGAKGGGNWICPRRQSFPEAAQKALPSDYETLSAHAKLDALDAVGLIHWNTKGKPRHKSYRSTRAGTPVTDVWTDIRPLNSQAKERTQYPTQKPTELLKRLIEAHSKPGDVVLDPFCGCATTCIAAEDAGREWIGVDISPRAVDLVRARFRKELPLLSLKLNPQTEPPQRTDSGKKRSANVKHTLYGQQAGDCNGCGEHFHIKNMTIDHKVPRTKGGPDTDDNLQLLCQWCNSVKGDRDMAYLRAQIKARTKKGTDS